MDLSPPYKVNIKVYQHFVSFKIRQLCYQTRNDINCIKWDIVYQTVIIQVMNVDGLKVSYFQNFRIIESSFFLAQLSFLCIRAYNDTRPTKQAACRSRLSVRGTLRTSVPIWGSNLVCIRCKVELGLHIPHVVWLAIQIQQWRVGFIFKIDFLHLCWFHLWFDLDGFR